MPLTPSNGDKHAAPLIRLYRLIELALWRILAKLLGLERGWGRRWLMRMMMRLPNFRRATRRIVSDAANQTPDMVTTAINRGWRDGTRAARADTGSRTEHFDADAVQEIVGRVLAGLDTAHRGVLADTENIYRRVIDEVARDPNIGSDNELHTLLRETLQRNARFGFVATTDQHGRRREFVAYAEQQIRGGVTTAEVEGFCAQALADGADLFIVSDVPGACRLCTPFEGRVISITGTTVGAITRDTRTGHPVPVNVMCSLAEARQRGLFHYGCRHTIKVWTPDDPTPPRAVRASETQRAANRVTATQRRAIRARKRVAVASGTVEVPRMVRRSDQGDRPSRRGPSVPPSPFDNATSPVEIGQILQLRHGLPVEGFDLPGLSLEVVQEYARAVDDMMTRYPQMRPTRILIGPVRSPDPDRVFGEAPNRKPKGQPRYVEHVVLNYLHASDPDTYRSAMEADVADNYHSPGFEQRPVYAVIVHEFGHVLDVAGQLEGRREADEVLDQHWKQHYPRHAGESDDDWAARYDSWLRQLPGYCFDPDGQFFAREAIAEAFAEVELRGDNASEPAKVLHKLLVDKSRRDS